MGTIKNIAIALLALVCVCTAQQADSSARERPAEERRFRGIRANNRVGIDIDRFVGRPFTNQIRVTHEVMLKQPILRKGDPYNPGDAGAVLEYREDLAHAWLLPHNATPLVESELQHIFYIQSGSGRLDNGSLQWGLQPGIAVLVPAGVPHRLSNTGAGSLEMLMLSWESPEGVVPRKDILVRDANLLPFAEKNAHWNNMAKNLFHPSDGLHPNEKILVVYLPPMAMASPHPHVEGWEEVWTNIGPGPSILMLGSELREMPANTAFLSPPNGQTVHAAINTTKDEVQAFFYFGRYTQQAPDDFGDEGTVAGQKMKKK